MNRTLTVFGLENKNVVVDHRATNRIQKHGQNLHRGKQLNDFKRYSKAKVRAGIHKKRLMFIIGSVSERGKRYYEPYLSRNGIVCDGSHGACVHYERYADGKEDRNCSHCLLVENRLMRGTVEFKGRALTSDMAFRELMESGVLGADRSEVLHLIMDNPSQTTIELHRIWNDKRRDDAKPPKRLSTTVGRVSDLKKMCFVASAGLRKNEDSGHPANEWIIVWKNVKAGM